MNSPFNPPVLMHINYLEQGPSLGEACRKAVDWGYDGIEFRRRPVAGMAGVSGLSEEGYLDAVAEGVSRSGLRKVSFGMPGPDLMGADAAGREREIAAYEKFLVLASERFELDILNTTTGPLLDRSPGVNPSDNTLHGSAIATAQHREQAAEGLRRIAATCEQLGLRLALELHGGYLHDLPSPTLGLLEQIGSKRIGANLDYGNIVYFPNPPGLAASVELLREHLLVVHLKNSLSFGPYRKNVSLEEGEINNREFLRLLKANRFEGYLCPEAPRAGDREAFAQPDLAYLKRLLAELV